MEKIRRAYPKIPDTKNCPLKQCIAFEKLDGTNFHVIYEKDKNDFAHWNDWQAFGTRRYRFDFNADGIKELEAKYSLLAEAPHIFRRQYSSILELYRGFYNTIELYFEFLGDNSFAGIHNKSDKKRLVLIDIALDGKMMEPQRFIDTFQNFTLTNKDEYYLPRVIFKGKYSGQLVEDIRKGKYKVFEGAVIKGVVNNEVYYAKVKTDQYMHKLKEHFGEKRWQDYWE